MTVHIAGLLCFLVFLTVSVYMRYRNARISSARQIESIESPMSRALQATVGYAGGVYITLTMLTSFLQIEVPDKIIVANGLSVEPLAFLAVVLTIIQPIMLGMQNWLKRKM